MLSITYTDKIKNTDKVNAHSHFQEQAGKPVADHLPVVTL
jgi:hypothetical protein